MRVLRIDLAKCDAGRHCNHECEKACAEKVFKFEDPARAALHIRELADGTGEYKLCDQCGDCLIVCPTNALTRNRFGAVMIDKKICVGCYMCVAWCDKDVFERAPGWVEPYKCTSCGVCVKACPHAALSLVEEPLSEKRAPAETGPVAQEERA